MEVAFTSCPPAVFTLAGTPPLPPPGFEWDEDKRAINLAKHGVDFFDIVPMFSGRFSEDPDDRRDYGEIRIRCLGEMNGRVFAVAYVWRGETRRIISARKANAREQRAYFARHA